MNKLLIHDLEDANFFLYVEDLYIKLPVVDVAGSDDGITLELGNDNYSHLVIWKDTIVTEVDSPADVIANFDWCYEIKNKNNKILGYLAA